MTCKPFPQSFWAYEGLLCAGCYPGDLDLAKRDTKLRGLLDCNIRLVVSLMEATEKSHDGGSFAPYVPRLQELAAERGMAVECRCLPIRDASAPTRLAMREVLDTIDAWLQRKIPTYVHCWGGHGRTSTVIACHLIRRGSSPQRAIQAVLRWRVELPKNHFPFEGDQEQFVLCWTGDA